MYRKTDHITGSILKAVFLFTYTILVSCYQYPEIDDSLYEEYRRVIGPKGGKIEFYRNYENDSIKDLALILEFPENALNTFIVFNMYEYTSSILDVDLFNMDRVPETDFLYLVPFYESSGYNEHSSEDIDEHISVVFNTQVEVTYYFNDYIIDENAVFYKIKIPSENEWGPGEDNNIWVNYNDQGYPNGYNEQDLMYLINGKWTEEHAWGSGPISFDNWEEMNENEYTATENAISFKMENTDNIFVLAVDITK